MIEVIKLSVVIVFIVLLLRKKWNLEYILLSSSLLLGLIFELNIGEITVNSIQAILDPSTISLVGIIILIMFLTGILRRIDNLKDITNALSRLVKDYRLILAFIPSFLGLLPIPAGAMLSAPMVNEIGDQVGLQAEEKTFVNYWFRHIWEFIWPLYPSILFYSALLEVNVRKIVVAQFPLTLIAMALGYIWELRALKRVSMANKKENILFNLKKLFLATWPILLVICLVIFVKADMLMALTITILFLLIFNRTKLKGKDVLEIIKKDISLSTALLITGIMIFKRMLQVTGAVTAIPEFFTMLGIHPLIILFFIPFLIGVLTGMPSTIIGVAFPILLPFMVQQGEVNLNHAMFAYAGGFMGHMISPVHLCLVITIDYFKADLGKIYKILIPFLSIIVLSALIIVIIKT